MSKFTAGQGSRVPVDGVEDDGVSRRTAGGGFDQRLHGHAAREYSRSAFHAVQPQQAFLAGKRFDVVIRIGLRRIGHPVDRQTKWKYDILRAADVSFPRAYGGVQLLSAVFAELSLAVALLRCGRYRIRRAVSCGETVDDVQPENSSTAMMQACNAFFSCGFLFLRRACGFDFILIIAKRMRCCR